MRAIDKQRFRGSFNIWRDQTLDNTPQLTQEDWNQILASSQHFPIRVYSVNDQEIAKIPLNTQGGKLLTVIPADIAPANLWRLICDTQISFNQIADDSITFQLDSMIASRGTAWSHLTYQGINIGTVSASDILDSPSHWVFKTNPNGAPVGLLLPFEMQFLQQASKLTELETLSLDLRWLESLQDLRYFSRSMPQDISPLGNLSQLKWLDLPSGLRGANNGSATNFNLSWSPSMTTLRKLLLRSKLISSNDER